MDDDSGELRGGLGDGVRRGGPRPDMGHDETADAGIGGAPSGLRRRMVPGHAAIGLAEEQIAVEGEFDERGAGLAVPGVDERAPLLVLHAQGEGGQAAVVDRARAEGEPADAGDMPVVQLLDGEGPFDGAAVGSVGEEGGEPVGDAWRAEERDGQREIESRIEQRVEGGEQIGAVVGVQMGDPHGVDLAEGHVPLELGEGAGPGVHPQADAAALDEVAGAGVARPGEGGGGPEDGDPQRVAGHAPSLGRPTETGRNLCRESEEHAYPVCSPDPIGGRPAEN